MRTFLAMALTVGAAAAGGGQSPVPSPVSVLHFAPPAGVIETGDSATSVLTIQNVDSAPRRVWIGYSVQDASGRWYDVPAHALDLEPGDTATARKSWVVAGDSLASGWYRALMVVWSAEPGTQHAVRLVSMDGVRAFRVRGDGMPVSELTNDRWGAAGHHLGRGAMQPEHAVHMGEGFALRLLAGSCDGAEIRTVDQVHYGEYTARMRTPMAPGSLSAFFLYGDVRHANDEIDIEIFNDGSRRMMLTTWVAGKEAANTEVRLPFDPATGFHDYTIRWTERELTFLADGVVMGRTTRLYPHTPMRLMASVWWPNWLSCEASTADRQLTIERVHLAPAGK